MSAFLQSGRSDQTQNKGDEPIIRNKVGPFDIVNPLARKIGSTSFLRDQVIADRVLKG